MHQPSSMHIRRADVLAIGAVCSPTYYPDLCRSPTPQLVEPPIDHKQRRLISSRLPVSKTVSSFEIKNLSAVKKFFTSAAGKMLLSKKISSVMFLML